MPSRPPGLSPARATVNSLSLSGTGIYVGTSGGGKRGSFVALTFVLSSSALYFSALRTGLPMSTMSLCCWARACPPLLRTRRGVRIMGGGRRIVSLRARGACGARNWFLAIVSEMAPSGRFSPGGKGGARDDAKDCVGKPRAWG